MGLGATPLAYGPDLPAQLERRVPARVRGVDRPRRDAAGRGDRPGGAEAGGEAVTIALGERPRATASRSIQVQRSQARLARLLADAAAGSLRMPVQTCRWPRSSRPIAGWTPATPLGKTVLDLADNPYLPEA